MSLVRSISGLRGVVGKFLTPEIVVRYVCSFADYLPSGLVVVGRDGRQSGKWIEEVVVGSLLTMGKGVLRAGIVPTPTIQLLVTELGAVGGISVTASHNPEQWNGLKFINSDGVFLDQNGISNLWDIADSHAYNYQDLTHSGWEIIPNPEEIHINKILELPIFRNNVNLSNIKARKYKVVVDAINSSGSKILPMLLEQLGCEVIRLNCNLNGEFVHNPEPRPEYLHEISEAVKNGGADLGVVVDPDADRLVLIDENGKPVWEELTIVLAVNSVGVFKESFGEQFLKRVVVNYSTTELVDFVSQSFGFKVYRAPVGEINVVDKMKEVNAVVGGEGSGGVILPACHYGRDSLVGIALILSLLSKEGDRLSKLIAKFPVKSMQKLKVKVSDDFELSVWKLMELLGIHSIDINREDGFRASIPNGWFHIRRSNTEPIARIIVETSQEGFLNEFQSIIEKIFEVVN